ncbi:hypothetical protein C2E23DRAFT_890776 [Lenzites betulinus]|nr:hypothetical protein C2E23DRAFT_890776 [Lenzites betulinus]
MSRNGLNDPSPSPVVNQSKRALDEAFYQPSTPTLNGIAHTTSGSMGNATGHLIRDLKDKEEEVEALKNKETCTMAALLKAGCSGFTHAESEQPLLSRAHNDDFDRWKATEMLSAAPSGHVDRNGNDGHHVHALEQTCTALAAVSTRAEEEYVQCSRAREQIEQLEADVGKLRGELEVRTTEVDKAHVRLLDGEDSWANGNLVRDAPKDEQFTVPIKTTGIRQ